MTTDTPDIASDSDGERTTGILPSQSLREMVEQGREILLAAPLDQDQIQPASLDLRLGPIAYRVRASFLPGRNSTVEQKLERYAMYTLDLTKGAVFERNCVYIVPLLESLALRKRMSAIANPKSSTGRLDLFSNLIGCAKVIVARSTPKSPPAPLPSRCARARG